MALKTSSASAAGTANRKDLTTAKGHISLEHRHFCFIAATLRATMPESAGPELTQWDNMVLHFATECRATNPKFDRRRFITACGA